MKLYFSIVRVYYKNMAEIDNEFEKKEELQKKIEEVLKERVPPSFEEEKEKGKEKPELTFEEEAAQKEKEELKRVLEKEVLSPREQEEAQREAEIILKEETVKGQISHLLDLAKAKGFVFAVESAKKTDDPYLLDLFHDILTRDELYKSFLR